VKNKLNGKTHIACRVLICLCLQGFSCAYAAESGAAPKSVNAAAALRSLQNAVSLLGSADWQQAAFEARLGATYDPAMADFPYIEALSLSAQGAPRADIIERLESSLAPELFWRSYTKDSALLLCAREYAETCRYPAALSRLAGLTEPDSADADYVRILCQYGMGRKEEARRLVDLALDRWPFDSRFARVFFIHEVTNAASALSVKTASVILSRLYLWENEDRLLLILSVPFESDPAVRERNIRIYRGMGKTDAPGTPAAATPDPLSAIYALEYGVITEADAVAEILSAEKTGISLSNLTELCRLSGAAELRKAIAARLDSYEGIITDDANGDGIVDARVQYRLGRPVMAVFDRDQDGYADYTVTCELGAPSAIAGRKDNPLITYDKYPSVRTVLDGNREYTIKPLALSWAPVAWVRQDFKLGGLPFYTIKLTGTETALTERLLINSAAFFTEPATDRPGAQVRFTLEAGVPVSSESRENGKAYAWTTWKAGFPSQSKTDRDGDGYFETTMNYAAGGRLASVLVDRNANRRNEYREQYAADGTVTKQWDSDENGIYEISSTVSPGGAERIEWLRNETGLPVIISVEDGKPRSVSYGTVRYQVLKDPVAPLWWIERIPENSAEIVKKINEAFNHPDVQVVSCKITVGGKQIRAVRTGGLVFAELMDE